MRDRIRKKSFGIRAVIAAVAAGSAFQISSCSIDENGQINAFADTLAISDLRNQLFDASPIGRWLEGLNDSVENQTGEQN